MAVGVLLLCGVCAAVLVHWCMSSGIGVTPDSVIYLSAADRLVEGKGLTPIGYHYAPAIPSGRPLISFPPAYSLLLASTSLFTNDRLAGAKYIHTLLFALTVFLLGGIVYISSRSIWPALLAMGLFQTSYPLLSIYAMARAEPLFMLLLLSTLLGVVLYKRKPRLWVLIVCASTAAAALMTRYVGLTVLVPLVLTVVMERRPTGERLRRVIVMLAVALLPLVAWLIRNRRTGGSSTGRSWAFHFVGRAAFNTFVESLRLLFTPYALGNIAKLLLLAIAAVAVVWALWMGLRGQTSTVNRCVRFFSAVMIITYVVFLAAYNSFADPAVDLGPRVALPVYLFGLILLFSLVEWESAARNRRALFWSIVFLSLVLFVANSRPAAYWVSYRHREGEGFTSRAWRDSETVKFLKAVPSQVLVYSNAADACYLHTNQEALRLPAKYDPTNARINAEFAAQITVLQNDLTKNRAVVVYFDRVDWRWYLPGQHELEETYKFPVAARLADGVVYGGELQTSNMRSPE